MGMATSLNKWDNRLGTMGNIYGSIDNGGNLWTRLARETGKILGNCTEKYGDSIWGFPKMGVSNNGWFVRENPIERDDLGFTPHFRKPPYMTGGKTSSYTCYDLGYRATEKTPSVTAFPAAQPCNSKKVTTSAVARSMLRSSGLEGLARVNPTE